MDSCLTGSTGLPRTTAATAARVTRGPEAAAAKPTAVAAAAPANSCHKQPPTTHQLRPQHSCVIKNLVQVGAIPAEVSSTVGKQTVMQPKSRLAEMSLINTPLVQYY